MIFSIGLKQMKKLLIALLVIFPSFHSAFAFKPVIENEKTYTTLDGEFMVHYTLEGNDALRKTTDMEPANGIPDVVDYAIKGFYRIKELYIDKEGWMKWLPDEDGILDLYFVNISRQMNAAGYTTIEGIPGGTFAPYVVLTTYLDNYFAEEAAAHELHHAIQLSYNPYLDPWIYEAQSSHAEYRLYGDDLGVQPRVEAAWQERLSHPEYSLDTANGYFEYTGFVWMKYLIDRNGGDMSVLIALWEDMASEAIVYDGHNKFFERMGLGSFEEEFATYTEFNIFACGEPSGYHYLDTPPRCTNSFTTVAYEDVTSYPKEITSGTIEPLGATYLRLEPTCDAASFSVSFSSVDSTDWKWGIRVVAVPLDDTPPFSEQFFFLPDDAELTFTIENQANYAEIFLIAQNLSRTKFKKGFFNIEPQGALGDGASAEPGRIIVGPTEEWYQLSPGDTVKFAAIGAWGNCKYYPDYTQKVEWFSSNERAASPVGNGIFEILDYGEAEIWAEYDELKSAPYKLTVTNPNSAEPEEDDSDAGSRAAADAGKDATPSSDSCSCRAR
ncbi:MAG: hypothetical protein Kow0090_14550 [Myxococcota bacterium]